MAPGLIEVVNGNSESSHSRLDDIKTLSVVEEKTVQTWQEVHLRKRQEILRAIPSEYILASHLLTSINSSNLVKVSGLLD